MNDLLYLNFSVYTNRPECHSPQNLNNYQTTVVGMTHCLLTWVIYTAYILLQQWPLWKTECHMQLLPISHVYFSGIQVSHYYPQCNTSFLSSSQTMPSQDTLFLISSLTMAQQPQLFQLSLAYLILHTVFVYIASTCSGIS